MIAGQIVVTDGLSEPLARFGEAAPKMLDKILKIVGYRYRAYLEKNYLSGQMLSVVSGRLVGSLTVGRRRGQRGVWLVGSKGKTSRQSFGGVSIKRVGDASVVKLANIYEHAGGYVIKPKTKKALIVPTAAGIFFTRGEVHGQARPFMSESSRTFPWSSTVEKTTEEVIGKTLKEIAEQEKPATAWPDRVVE